MLTKTYVQDWTLDSTWLECSPSQFALDALFYVQEIGHFCCHDEYYAEHEGVHSFLILLTVEGEGLYHVGGKTYKMGPGDLLFADCMPRNVCETAGSMPWEFQWVHFNGICAKAYYNEFMQAQSPVISPKNAGELHSLMTALIETSRNTGRNAELTSADLITQLLTKTLIQASATQEARAHLPVCVARTLKEIHTRLTDDLTLDHFARTLGINKYHLQKEFKRCMGMSPNAYVCAARINTAKSLLQSKDLTVSEVAARAGFRNMGHFTNMFKRATGCTPGEYRRRGVHQESPV